MRLIDVDAFKADYRMADECKDCKTPVRACEYDRVYAKMDFCSWLDDAPTIEPERKTGKWIFHRPPDDWVLALFTCDQCGYMNEGESRYCPGCGADMRGELK